MEQRHATCSLALSGAEYLRCRYWASSWMPVTVISEWICIDEAHSYDMCRPGEEREALDGMREDSEVVVGRGSVRTHDDGRIIPVAGYYTDFLLLGSSHGPDFRSFSNDTAHAVIERALTDVRREDVCVDDADTYAEALTVAYAELPALGRRTPEPAASIIAEAVCWLRDRRFTVFDTNMDHRRRMALQRCERASRDVLRTLAALGDRMNADRVAPVDTADIVEIAEALDQANEMDDGDHVPISARTFRKTIREMAVHAAMTTALRNEKIAGQHHGDGADAMQEHPAVSAHEHARSFNDGQLASLTQWQFGRKKVDTNKK